jgi:hypothetical protein
MGFLKAEIIIPQLALGEGYECIVLVSNKGDTAWVGNINTFMGKHEAWFVDWIHPSGVWFSGYDSNSIRLQPNGTLKYRLFRPDSKLEVGYLSVTGNDGSNETQIVISYFYLYKDSQERLMDSVGVPVLEPGTAFVFPVERTADINTGFAWATGDIQDLFEITLVLFDDKGQEVESIQLEYEGHLAKFFSELFQSVPEVFIGMIRIESEQPIHLTALRLETTEDGFQLTSTPPAPTVQ